MTLLMLLACKGCREAEPAGDPVYEACEIEQVPQAQLRLLTHSEYDNALRELVYGPGQDCLTDSDCSDQSCLHGVCRPTPCDVTTFQWHHGGDEVWLAGTFNDWSPEPMSQRDGVWEQTMTLEPGQWVYKFVVDGEWLHDHDNDWTEDDGYGGLNNVVELSCTDFEYVMADPSRGFPEDSSPEHFGFDNHAGNLLSSTHLLRYLEVGATVAPELAEQELEELAEAAWRRPLTGEELDRLEGLEDPELAVQHILASGNFLYRDETVDLEGYRMASAMSFFLWGGPPDEQLLQAAGAGELDTEAGIEEQALRMMEDPRALAQMELFAIQWLGLEGLTTLDKGSDGSFDGVRESILAEAGIFVSDEVYRGSGSLDALLTAELDPIDDIYDEGDARPGVLGLPAVLAANAHSDQTSPVRRGLFVRERLLCQDLGTPPADAGGVPDVDPSASTRERFEQHSDDPACSGCHQYIDPVGFGFEHYDEIGAWRDFDGSHEVDASGYLDGLEALGDGSGGDFATLPELAEMLAGSEALEQCFSEQVLRYATGTEESDCQAHQLAQDDIPELMLQVVLSDSFRRRPE